MGYLLTETQINSIKRRLISEAMPKLSIRGPKDNFGFDNITGLSDFIEKLKTFWVYVVRRNPNSKYIADVKVSIKYLEILESRLDDKNKFDANFVEFINLFYRPQMKTVKGKIGWLLRLVTSGLELANFFETVTSIIEELDKKPNLNKDLHLSRLIKLVVKYNSSPNLNDIILTYFEKIGVSPAKEYEESFGKMGYDIVRSSPKISGAGNKGLINHLSSDDMAYEEVCETIYDEIRQHVSDPRNIVTKQDIKYKGNDVNDQHGNPIIRHGDDIEVKHLHYSSDSYLSEFFAVGKVSEITKLFSNEVDTLEKYNQVVDCLYNKLNDSSNRIGETLLNHVIGDMSGIFFKDYTYVKSEDILFYISNKGRASNKQRRLSIRFKVVNGATVYKFNQVGDELTYGGSTTASSDNKLTYVWTGGEVDERPQIKI